MRKNAAHDGREGDPAMRKRFFAVVVLAVSGGLLWGGHAVAKEMKPGGARWAIKTSVEANAPAKSVPLAALLALKDVPGVTKNDARFEDARIAGFENPAHLDEGDMITTTGWVHLVAAEPDGDYRIQISASKESGDHCLVVKVPENDPAAIASAALRDEAGQVRAWIKDKLLRGKEPSARGSVMTHAPYVALTGQLFYDDARVGEPPQGMKGMKAATLWELHPVTKIGFAPAPETLRGELPMKSELQRR
jgi:hypothetical protein